MPSIAALLQQDDFLRTLFEAIPCGIIVVDEEGQVQAVNDVVKRTFHGADDATLRKAAGEAIGCFHALQNPEGCGRSDTCQNCQVRSAASQALGGKRIFRHKAGMQLSLRGEPRESTLLVSAAPVEFDGQKLAIVVLEDITELSRLQRQLNAEHGFAGIVGRDAKMLELFDTIRELGEVNVPVLIQGESGTGKELVAQAIHAHGPRAAKPFVAVNCGALPDALLESELFGHVEGSFTGATRDRRGRFELSHGGTIFLDEVGDLSAAMQVKLLRVLQESTFERVGSEETVQVDVRVLSATNKDLRHEISTGRFREDLFYRLCIVPVTLPALRDRTNDIPLLAEHFLQLAADEWRRPKPALAPEAMAALMDHAWPGNVRELQNAVQFALVKCRGDSIDTGHLPPSVLEPAPVKPRRRVRKKKLQQQAVEAAMTEAAGNKARAAKILGVSRATLYRFIGDSSE